jgi:hypothetical protein
MRRRQFLIHYDQLHARKISSNNCVSIGLRISHTNADLLPDNSRGSNPGSVSIYAAPIPDRFSGITHLSLFLFSDQ